MRETGLRTAGLIAATTVAALLFAAPAGAATVGSPFCGALDVTAGAGEVNAMTIGVSPSSGGSVVTVEDTGAPLTAGNGCDQPTPAGAVTCSVSGLYIVFVHLGDGDDTLAVDNHDPSVQFTIGAGEGADSVDVGPLGEVCLDGNAGVDHLTITTPSQACIIDGGDGKDVLTGSDGLDRLYGGADPDVVLGQGGNDYVYGDEGNDQVDGGPGDEVVIDGGPGDDTLAGEGGNDHLADGSGDDELEGDSGADTFSSSFFFDSGDDAYTGGPGRDRFVYFCPACRISLDHTANDGRASISEADNVDVEGLSVPSRVPPDPDEGDPGHNYGSGNDTLVGDAQDNVFLAQRGDDQLTGKGGADVLSAGHGADVIRAADGVADPLVDCGPGEDTAFVDALDTPEGCEHVHVAP